MHPEKLAILIVAALLGCGGSDDEAKTPPGATRTDPPAATCDAQHTAEGAACAPKFDACGDLEVPTLGGGCVAVGIPTCSAGFMADGRGGCEPVLPKEACPAGSLVYPGAASCETVDCGSGTYGAIPDAAGTLHVDRTYTGGGSDGTRARPFTKISDAVARAVAGSVVAIAAGTYEEDVNVDKAIKVAGRCPSMVTIRGVATGSGIGAFVTTAASTLESVSVTGPATGVIVYGATGAIVSNVRVFGASVDTGIWIRKGSRDVIVRHSEIDGVSNYGLAVSGSTARIEKSRVANVRELKNAAGVKLNPDPTTFAPVDVTVVQTLIEGNDYTGVAADSAKATLDGCLIRNNRPSQAPYFGGYGIAALRYAPSGLNTELTLRGSMLDRNVDSALLMQATKVTVESSVVRETQRDVDAGIYGRGIVAQGIAGPKTELVVRSSVVERNYETGIDVNGNVIARIERTIVRDTKENKPFTGTGIYGELLVQPDGTAPELEIVESLITNNPHAGVVGAGKTTVRGSRIDGNTWAGIAGRGSEVTVEATVVRNTKPYMGLHGYGVLDTFDHGRGLAPTLSVTDSAIEDAAKHGVALFGGTLTLTRSVVRNIGVEAATAPAGAGVVVTREVATREPTATIDATLIVGARSAGVLATGANVTLTASTIRGVRAPGDGKFGDGVLLMGALFSGDALVPSSAGLRGSIIEDSARAGIGVFGSNLSLEGAWLSCNRIAINVEQAAAWNGTAWVQHEFGIADAGGNVCTCGSPAKCSAQSSNLTPLEAAPDVPVVGGATPRK